MGIVLLQKLRDAVANLREEFEDRLVRTNERLDQTLASLGRIESDLNELKKFTRQIALHQAKQELTYSSEHVERLENEILDLQQRLQRYERGAGH